MIKKKEVDWGNIIFDGFGFAGFIGLLLFFIFKYIMDFFFENWDLNLVISIHLSHLVMYVMLQSDAEKGDL